ncbi:hypothetical protein ACFLTP_08920 [Chloroflexota bacterium]
MASAKIEGYNLVVDLNIETEHEGENGETIDYSIDSDGPVRNNAEMDAICDGLKEHLKDGIIPIVAVFVPSR